MNANTAADALLLAAAVVWILWKQVKAAPIKTRLLVLSPLVLGYFGLRNTPGTTWTDSADLAFILIGGLFSLGLGLARGATIRVWRGDDGTWWRQGSKMTLILWGALLVVRAALAGTAQATHHSAASGLGPVLFSLALSFAAQNAVTALRMNGGVNGGAFAAGNAPRDTFASPSQPTGIPASPTGTQGYGQTYGPADASQGYGVPSIHERREQRHADRRARRASRRGW